MFVLFTDFGMAGPYLGQMKAVLLERAPGVPIVDLMADAPACNPRAAAYLLPNYSTAFPVGSVFLVVVDPGVGTPQREPVVVEADGRWFVGPGNGLFSLVQRRAAHCRCWKITLQPEQLSASFHGRDLFAPVAAAVALGDLSCCQPAACCDEPSWPDDLPEVVYIDHFGNVVTGIRAVSIPRTARVVVGQNHISYARTFGATTVGAVFWYENSNGLLELAVNQGRAADVLGMGIGDSVRIVLVPPAT